MSPANKFMFAGMLMMMGAGLLLELYDAKTDKETCDCQLCITLQIYVTSKEGANKQVISSQADSLIKISRIWADFFPANTSNQPI
nr:hypothetical protein [Escherichia coli]